MRILLLAVFIGLCGFGPAIAQMDSEPMVYSPTFRLGVQLFTGYDAPVLQQDIGSGMMWGLAARANVWRFVHGELFFRGTSQGDAEVDTDIPNDPGLTIRGGTLTGFGLNVLFARQLPADIWPYGLLSLSTNSLKRGEDVQEDQTLMGWSFGGGTGINLYNQALYLDVNTSLLVMPFHDNEASRKNWQTRLGIQYFIPIGQQ